MDILGHHTCSKTGNISKIETNGPFLSVHEEHNTDQHKFLGTGYYFWDNNIGMAHSHGQRNYRRQYYIFVADLEFENTEFLDLAGNRKDMLQFQAMLENLIAKKKEAKNWSIGQFIAFLEKHKKFSFKYVRAVDSTINKDLRQFVSNRPNSINLNPVFIVCIKKEGLDSIKSFKHIKTYPNGK